MRFISIGVRCNVAHQINQRDKRDTLFFDWIHTNMDSVLNIIGCRDILTLLNPSTITYCRNHCENAVVSVNSLSLCRFAHDLLIGYTEQDVLHFIEKYSRRWSKIRQLINSDEKLCFIRYKEISDIEAQQFIETILSINPSCDFILINVVPGRTIDSATQTGRVLKLEYALPDTIDTDWQTNNINWNSVFAAAHSAFASI